MGDFDCEGSKIETKNYECNTPTKHTNTNPQEINTIVRMKIQNCPLYNPFEPFITKKNDFSIWTPTIKITKFR